MTVSAENVGKQIALIRKSKGLTHTDTTMYRP